MSLVIHYWIGDVQDCQGVSASEMTYIVSSGALNSTHYYYHYFSEAFILFCSIWWLPVSRPMCRERWSPVITDWLRSLPRTFGLCSPTVTDTIRRAATWLAWPGNYRYHIVGSRKTRKRSYKAWGTVIVVATGTGWEPWAVVDFVIVCELFCGALLYVCCLWY